MTGLNTLFNRLDFKPYQAQAYVALRRENPANGYALVKLTGISHSNVDPMIQKTRAGLDALQEGGPWFDTLRPLIHIQENPN